MSNGELGCNTDYYRKWAVTIGADETIEIRNVGRSCTQKAEGWLNLTKGMLPESAHIKAFTEAIHWHFGPSDALKVMHRYLELINKKDEAEHE